MPPGLLTAVTPGRLGARLGIRSGDCLVSINGVAVRDVIDVQVLAAEERLTLTVLRQNDSRTLAADRQYGESFGLEFATPTFDPVRRCINRCEFCFLDQMPGGLRSSLYVRDDDYRLSFLFGNYVTLTGLDEDDWTRISEQLLSPLYVSVHATDPGLRRRMLGDRADADVLAQLKRLAGIGVEIHTQIVLVPGVNDGAHVDRSVADLVELYPAVRSVSIVPVGVTKYHRGSCRVHAAAEMRRVCDQVTRRQSEFRSRLSARFVYLSDEWYLATGEPIPPIAAYDGLDLAENGVGAVRRFLDEIDHRLRPALAGSVRHTLVTGTLFAPLLREAIAGWSGVTIVPVVNRFFGETVTVAGLLTGEDVVFGLRGRELGEAVVLPPEMFGGPDGQSLDEMGPGDVERSIGCRVIVGGLPRGLRAAA